MAVDLGTAYISLVPTTKDLDKGIRKALDGTVKYADKAGDGMGVRIAASVTSHMGRAGASSADAFGKKFTPQVLGVGRNAMLGLANLMSGLATGMGSRVGGNFAAGMGSGIAAGSTSAVRALSGVSAAATGVGSGIAAAGAVAAAGIAAVGVAAIAASGKLYQMGSQWDDISDGIVIKTGLIGTQFDKLTKSIDNVVYRTAATPGSVAEVASTLVQTLRLQGDELEKATLQISDYNDMNIKSPLNVREFSKVMKQFKVSARDIPDVLDRLNIVAQDTGIPLNELVSLMKTAGPQARQFGLSIDGLANLMANFESAGLDADSSAIALRTSLASLAKSRPGEDPVTALKNTVAEIQRLQQSGKETAAIDLAKSTFGRGWAQISDLIRDNRFDLDQMNTSVDTQGRRISDIRSRTADWREDWQRLKNTIEEALKPLSVTLFDNLQKALIKVNDWIRNLFNLPNVGPTGTAAAAPGGSAGGGVPFNAGPMAPNAAAGQAPLGGSTMGLSSVPAFGLDANGNPLTPNSGGFNPGPMKPGAKPGVITGTGTPYGLPAGTGINYGDPGFPDWVNQLGARFGVKPSTYGGHQEGSGSNRGIDWVGSVEQMQAFAEFLISAKPPGLEQVIWQNPNTNKRLGLTPDGQVVTVPDGYYRDNWSGHRDHVHTRFSQNLDLSKFATGGGIRGPGTGTSDSIPAMLSNGEHVLTASDVKAMGGQNGVYAFRSALQKGLIPGFAPGGAVDPSQIEDLNNSLEDARVQSEVAQAQFNETMANTDASDLDKLQAQINLGKAQRDYQQLAADYPISVSGGTPPDRSIENNILDSTDQLKIAQQRLADAQSKGDVPYSQMLQLQASLDQAQRGRDQAIAAKDRRDNPNFLDEFKRTAGFTPVAAGNTGVAGTSSLASFIGMGSDVVGGLIDTGASLAQTAVTAASAASGNPQAAGPANYGIQLGANVLKRGAAYGFQLAGIGADALVAQLFPFGAPRWIGYDYTQFMPQLGIQEAALTSIEKMGQNAINKYFNPGQKDFQVPGQPTPPAAVNTSPESTLPTPPDQAAPQVAPPDPSILQEGDPGFYKPPWTPFPFNPGGGGGNTGGGSWAKGGAISIYDQGGVLKPGDLALNASRRPEKVLTDKQWDALSKIQPVGRDAPLVKIDAIYGLSPQDVAAQIESKQKLAMMRYSGRP